ncbi:hypothetical protein [Rhizobium sp. S163]|uniref:hypothetical protein n=1 Tax=Rhizobium sp. S163 TaxID=3055039 RepID=UPI0025AA048A|nr:hypothetical protein [Rhizobium sp. S163]MDM9643889.1 hypothetical protein [Rhizobium sp. S163]
MDIMIDDEVVKATAAQQAEIVAAQNALRSDMASRPYTIAKSTPWIRMTGDEAELITGAMQQADARLKGIYDASTYLNSADPLWTTLHDMIATTLGSTSRADELLAPET